MRQELPDMTPKPHEPREPNRSAALRLDWATAATEARRRRDAEAKVTRSEKQLQWRQAHAWSPKEFFQTRRGV